MADKISLSIAVVAILISAGSLAYTSSVVGGVSTQIDQAKKDLIGQVGSQANQVNSKISPLESSVNTVKQEQTAIRGLVDQRIGGLEKALQEAQTRLAQAEKAAQQSQKELQALQAEKALEEAAKKEKAPIVYGTWDAPDFINIMWPRFRESYPWAPAEARYVEGFAPLRSRFISEYQAGAPTADIIIQPQDAMIGQLKDYFIPFNEMKYKDLYPAELVWPNKDRIVMYTANMNYAVIVYNTNLVKDADVPKGWLDLADSKWKGKVVIHDPRTLAGIISNLLADLQLALGQQRWDAFMKGLAANTGLLTASGTEAYVKVVAGEFPIGVAYINDVLKQKPDTPLKVAWPQNEPKSMSIAIGSYVGIVNKAANPNFAKLWVTWLLSPSGQKALADTGRNPPLPSLDHPRSMSKVIPPGLGIFTVNEDRLKDPNKWAEIYKGYFK
ncbi:MAG: extracellular solute-binding protein [Thaumarchaeota archaeon]|nr:extracellular solute-binding protein [Nitrososphaerota archaeon]